MTNTCRLPGCDNPVGMADEGTYSEHTFCSPFCEVKYDHLKADARDAKRAAAAEADEPERYF